MSRREISIAFQTDKSTAQYIALAKLVNGYAFDRVSVYCDAPYHPAFAALLLMAPHITQARIGVAALPSSRIHPIDIAAQAALLAELAQGGIYLGFARGAWLGDMGIQEPAEPIQAVREAVEVTRYLLSGASGGYQGKVYSLADHVRAPYPLPDQLPPILIGSWGAKLCAVAGEIADEVKVGGSSNPDLIPTIQAYIAVGEQKAQRYSGAVGVVMGAVTVIDEDRKAARAAARRAAAQYLPVVAPLDPTLQVEPDRLQRIQTLTHQGDYEAAAALISDDLLERFAFSGDSADIIRQAEALFAAGASRIEFGTPHGIHPEAGIHLLGKRVLPALKEYTS